MGWASDLRVLYHLALKPVRGADHAERLESFYAGQAATYDAFRARMLPGRAELSRLVVSRTPDGGTWVDLGGGTGAALEPVSAELGRLGAVRVVDLSPSLLEVARGRIAGRGWKNVEAMRADAAGGDLAGLTADAVTFSYALTMIPDWFRALEQAWTMLRPGGVIGVVDFHVSRKHPPRAASGTGGPPARCGRSGSQPTTFTSRRTTCPRWRGASRRCGWWRVGRACRTCRSGPRTTSSSDASAYPDGARREFRQRETPAPTGALGASLTRSPQRRSGGYWPR